VSRDIRRVPVDFDWPLNKVWHGYVRSDELDLPPCPECSGQGSPPSYRWLIALANRLGMLADDALAAQPRGREMHPWLARDPYPPTRDIHRPVTDEERATARRVVAQHEARGEGAPAWIERIAQDGSTTLDQCEVIRPSDDVVDLVAGLSGESRERLGGFLGVSSSTSWRMAAAIVKAAGLPEGWGTCPTCDGAGDVGTAEQRAAFEAWQEEDPPTGDGWQLWESVSEGSPISPVFPDREGLIRWLTTDYSWGAQKTPLTLEQAEAFVGLGHSIGSGVILADGTHLSGEAAVAELGGRL
jgi:hypothetical protein